MKKLYIQILDSSSTFRVADFFLANAGNEMELVFDDVLCCPHFIVPIYALIDFYRARGEKINILAPPYSNIKHILFNENSDRAFGRVLRFSSIDEYLEIFNKVQKEVITLPKIGSGFRVAFEWCISEIMDNVVLHSGSSAGYFMVQYLQKERLLKTCVFDLGQGILASFKNSPYSPSNSIEAVKLAVEPNVTSGNGQGNGLYGLREIVKQSSNGRLQITSGDGKYVLSTGVKVEEVSEKADVIAGFPGATSVDFQVVVDDSLSIDRVFEDGSPTTDLWLEDHELDEETISIKVLELVQGTISRGFGREIRNAVENLIDVERKRVIIDFDGVDLCSSAFVDEFIGKLLVKYQFVNFARMISFKSLCGLPALLINHSIKQRMSESTSIESAVNDSVGTVNMGPTGPVPIPVAKEKDLQREMKPTIVEAIQ